MFGPIIICVVNQECQYIVSDVPDRFLEDDDRNCYWQNMYGLPELPGLYKCTFNECERHGEPSFECIESSLLFRWDL